MGHDEQRFCGLCLAIILLIAGQGCGSAAMDGELPLDPDNPVADRPIPSDDREPDTGEPVVARVEVTSHQVVLAGIGASQQLVATPVDKDGGPVEGKEVVWSSLDPDVVSVTVGGLATTEAVGMGELVAEVQGSGIATKVRVTASLPVPGTILVDPAHKRGDLVLLQAAPEDTEPFGARMEVVLSRAAPPLEAGDLLIFTDWSLSAVVDAVEVRANDVRLEVTVAPYDAGFEALELRVDYTLDELIFRDETGTASGRAERGSVATKALPSASPINVSLDGNAKLFDLGPFKCTTPIATVVDASSIVSTVEPTVHFEKLDVGFSQVIENFEVVELRFAPYVEMRVDLDGDLILGDAINGVMKCKFTDPLSPTIPPGSISTPPQTLGYVEIPHGFGFELVALAETQGTRVRFDGFVVASMQFGFAYTAADGWETINERSLDEDNLSVQTLPSNLTDEDAQTSELVATLFTFASSKAKVGVPGFTVSRTIENFETGFELSAQVGSANAQVRDSLFRSEAELYVYAERKVKDANLFLGGLNIMFPGALLVTTALGTAVDFESLFGWEFATELGRTPLGSMAPDGDFDEGESTNLRVNLDPAALDFWGSYQIDRVEVHRVSGSGGTMETHPFLTFGASEGQSVFEWDIAPNESDVEAGEIRLVAFAYSTEFPGVPLQLTEVMTYDVYEAETEPPVVTARHVADVEFREIHGGADDLVEDPQSLPDDGPGSVSIGGIHQGIAYSVTATSSAGEASASYDLTGGDNGTGCFELLAIAWVGFKGRNFPPGTQLTPTAQLTAIEDFAIENSSWDASLDVFASAGADGSSEQSGSFYYEKSGGNELRADGVGALEGYAGGGAALSLPPVVVGEDGRWTVSAELVVSGVGCFFTNNGLQSARGGYSVSIAY